MKSIKILNSILTNINNEELIFKKFNDTFIFYCLYRVIKLLQCD